MPDNAHKLATRILWGLGIGVVLGCVALGIGHFQPGFLSGCRTLADKVLDPFGQIFLRLLFFVVVPLVFASLALGVVQLGDLRKLGPLALRTAALFAVNMAIGVALGLLMMNTLKPGNALDQTTKDRLFAEFGGKAKQAMETREAQPKLNLATLVEMFMPRNIVKAVVEFQILPLILFAILLGAAGTQLDAQHRQMLHTGLDITAQLMTRIVHYALLLAPFAVPAMIFSVIVKVGVEILFALGFFVLAALGIIALHLFGTMSLWLKLFTRRSPREFFRATRAIMVTAFCTSSSNATLPTSLKVSRENLGLSPSTTGFVLPLGATMNMSGTALYEGCVVLFIAQIYGVNLDLMAQLTLLVLTVLSAVAVAGIPGGSLPLIAGLLVTFNVPPEGLAIIIGVDRILDMARTTLNVMADVVTAVVVDERMGETGGQGAP
ncbi:MAG: dicarboxylate/amino acid:cation symporter [Verrucomicrobiota bacterium]